MSPPKGTWRRLTGLLRMGRRSMMLEADDGALLSLLTSEDLAAYDGNTVIVEGMMVAPDRLHLEWIGRPAA